MIYFISQAEYRFTHKKVGQALGPRRVQIQSYEWLLNKTRLPRGTYIFTDRDRLAPWELRVFADLFRHIQQAGPAYRAINDPARMTNRYAMLRTLYGAGLNDFDAYLLTERRSPRRWPVFIRHEFNHDHPLTDLLQNQSALDAAVHQLQKNGEPLEGLLVTEYCAEPIDDDLFRKLAAYRVGDAVLFYNCVHEANWLVKYGTCNSATDALYREEQAMIRDNAYASEIRRAFELAGIDYGRADFGLVDGSVQVYEINTNPDTRPQPHHPNPIRVENQALAWKRYLSALRALDSTDPKGPLAPPFDYARKVGLRRAKYFANRARHLFRIDIVRR